VRVKAMCDASLASSQLEQHQVCTGDPALAAGIADLAFSDAVLEELAEESETNAPMKA
jgi:hypothetical protein